MSKCPKNFCQQAYENSALCSSLKGVFAIGFGGGNGDSLANQLQQDILAAPPKQKAQTAQDLGAYHIPLPGPAPSFDAALKTLDPTDQESL